MAENTVSIIAIGDELLLGQIVDTNSAWLGQELALHGFEVNAKYTVADEINDICEALTTAGRRSKYVIVSGGLGPTSDDMTIAAAERFFEDTLVEHEPTKTAISSYFESRGRVMSSHHAKQFYLPSNATVFANEVGTAPGIKMYRNGTYYFFVPGVPVEMKYLYEKYILPSLNNGGVDNMIRYHLFTAGMGETSLVELIAEDLSRLPPNIKMAYLPYHGGVRIRITGRDMDTPEKRDYLSRFKSTVIAKLGLHFVAENHNSWSTAMAAILKERGFKLATAESCTGGYIGHKMTSLSGSSEYFLGGIIAYDNEVKSALLNVKQETLDTHGAVSENCAREMLKGLCSAMPCDVGVVTTGIAGPTGGSKDKPVGTIFIGVGNENRQIIEKFSFRSSRLGNIESTYSMAMYMVYKFLSNQ
ncbi:CinA family nicotinamide mononucleotide deamidase-related protein [Membranihabitans marinus]|uniref:CinA family nicotinamide mononucleotide deamidase-related protein n=1 Tax=Membranihabitans marinus TaxID=1227546 RepID=UPI001F401773|nr:CinA family nicotinamide mononucleotide deamidase-related protein [Membranihabitans marinus]